MTTKESYKRPWIKICGLTDPANAIACAHLGPDAMGFVFFRKSPRNVTIGQAGRIIGILPPHILTIGVFVNDPFENILETVRGCGLKGVQLHGEEPPDLVDRLRDKDLFVIKALFASKEPHFSMAKRYSKASAFLLECGSGALPGGNAKSWNYEIPGTMGKTTPVILAGGLSPDNVAEIVSAVRPFGIDVSSGVEKSLGVKDVNKTRAFITRAAFFPKYSARPDSRSGKF